MTDPNEADIIDIQDKLGYVDTGPIQQRQAKATRNQPSYTPATSSTSHIILKEPIPQRQVHFPMDYNNNSAKKRSSTSARPEMGQNTFHGASQPPPHNTIKKSNSLDTATTALDNSNNGNAIPYSLNVSQQTLQQQQQQQQRPSAAASRSNSFNNNNNKGKERQHVTINETPSIAMPTSSTSSSSSTDPSLLKYSNNSGNIGLRGPPQTTQATEEIKDLIVSKFLELKELADILQLINEPLPQPMYNHKRSFEPQQQPRPTPSKSDPNYPQLRRKPSQGRMTAGYAYPSPENNRHMYNKSADSTTNYQEPNNRHTTSSRGIYNNSNNNNNNYQMDHHDSRTPHDGNGYYGHPPPPQAASYYHHHLYDNNRDYYLANEEPFRVDHEDYYMGHPHPPPHQVYAQQPSRFYNGRQRRKSFSNLHEEQYRLNRKGSRGNMRRPMARQPQAPAAFYEYADMAPLPPPSHLHHPHHHPYPYGGGPPYYSLNQPYSPNGGGGGKGNGGGGGGGGGGVGDYYS